MSEPAEGGSPPPAVAEVQDLTKEEADAVAEPIQSISESHGSATLADWTRVALVGGLLGILAILTLASAIQR